MENSDYELTLVRDKPEDFQTYHNIRRQELFVARSRGDIYDPTRVEERDRRNYPFLLKYRGHGIGTARLDVRPDGTAVIRLVAVTKSEQGKGHGRVLSEEVEAFAKSMGIKKMFVNAAPEAVGYYEKLGYTRDAWDPSELVGISSNSIQMSKMLQV